MNQKIKNLEDLLREKDRLRTQLRIVQTELASSAKRTRSEFKTLVEDKFSISKQLGNLLQGSGGQIAEGAASKVIGRIIGGSSWWGGLVATLLPMVADFIRRQLEQRKARKAAEASAEDGSAPKTKNRNIFKRKKATDA